MNVPLGTVEPVGAVNIASTPDTGLFDASSRVTLSAVPNAVPTVADCGVVFAFVLIWVGVSTPSRIVTFLPVLLATARSALPSPLKSPTAIAIGEFRSRDSRFPP